MRSRLLALLFLTAVSAFSAQVELSIDSSEADLALKIVRTQSANAEDWQALLATAPYQRLKAREEAMGRPFTDEAFRAFLFSPEARNNELAWDRALAEMKRTDLTAIGKQVADWLPEGASIHARVFPEIKPAHNSFVWSGKGDDPAIFLYLDQQTTEQFENTVAHECHHIGLQSLEPRQSAITAGLPANVTRVVHWMGGFGEGEAMLAAAGSANRHPHYEDDVRIRARWDADLMHFNTDLPALEKFFSEILDGSLTDDAAIMKRAAPFWGDAQGAWYTVGYEMAMLVELRYGRPQLLKCMIDPRLLLISYNQIALDARASGSTLAVWSPEFLKRLSL
jgi:hypothetical protein